MDKQKQIEEMAKEREEVRELMRLLDKCVHLNPMYKCEVATVIYGNNYRKIPEGAVVLSKEEYDALDTCRCNNKVALGMLATIDKMINKTRKETAEKFAEMAKAKARPTYVNIDDNARKDSFIFLSDIDEICKEIIKE